MADGKFEVTWEVDDGYAGPARPQHFSVHGRDIDPETEAEARELFWELVEDEFRNSINPISDDESAFVKWAMSLRGDALDGE